MGATCVFIAPGFAGAFRRSELVALEVADLTEAPDGLRVPRFAVSKTDQTGQGQEVFHSARRRLRPVETLQAWLSASGISAGADFPSGQQIQPRVARRPETESAARVVKDAAERAGLVRLCLPGTACAAAS